MSKLLGRHSAGAACTLLLALQVAALLMNLVLALALQVANQRGGAVDGARRLEDGVLEGAIARDARHRVGDDHRERVHEVDVVGGGDRLHLAGRAIREAAVAHALPVGVLETPLPVQRTELGLDGAPLVLEFVIDRLLERLVSEAEVVRLGHLLQPRVLFGAEEVGRHS